MTRDPARPAGPASAASSPCINVCRMDASTGWCEGCLRTIDEIAAWGALDERARCDIRVTLSQRRVIWRRRRSAVAPD